MSRAAFHNCVSDNDFRDAELLSRGDFLLKRLADSALRCLLVVKGEEQLLGVRILDKVKARSLVVADELNDIVAGEDGDVSHNSKSTLKDKVRDPCGKNPCKTPKNYQGKIEWGDISNLSRARGGKRWSILPLNKYFIFYFFLFFCSSRSLTFVNFPTPLLYPI